MDGATCSYGGSHQAHCARGPGHVGGGTHNWSRFELSGQAGRVDARRENQGPKIASDQRAVIEWNVVTLPNDDANFTMDGVILLDAVVDTGARRVMIGVEIVVLMGLTVEDLEPRESYITVVGTL